jgi:hypothetical protein
MCRGADAAAKKIDRNLNTDGLSDVIMGKMAKISVSKSMP